ncbi:colicin-lik bacteriocin with DNase/tRNase domain [Thermoactinomyces vulgaris]|nr:HNH endonuclease [Thermoactinomyces vulgaris]RMB01381.1 colicin-lik bacteriocin with DNase/tRNase domain [Thermoactinomyces vulgaris]
MASGIGQKLIMGAKNSKFLGPVLRGGQKLVSKMPAPIQKMFTKGGFIGAAEGAGTSVADDILHGRKINWKNAVLSGIGGAALVGLGSFIVPKLDPIIDKVTTAFKKSETVEIAAKQVADCFSYRYQSNSYLAFIQVSNCVRTQQLTDEIRQKIKEENFQKYGEESKSRKPYSPHKDTGKITVREDGKRVLTLYDGTQRTIIHSEHAGKDVSIIVNGEDYKVPIDENGFPDFTKWTAYASTLNQDQYLLGDKAQFKLLSKRLYKDMTKNQKLRDNIDDTFLETLEKGVGEKNEPAKRKFKIFISKNSVINKNLTKTEIEDLLAGKGSSSIIEKLNKDPELKQKFLEANISWIEKGNDPVGFTWHHHQDEGKMQLVKTRIHGNIRHTGGRVIWGGGER